MYEQQTTPIGFEESYLELLNALLEKDGFKERFVTHQMELRGQIYSTLVLFNLDDSSKKIELIKTKKFAVLTFLGAYQQFPYIKGLVNIHEVYQLIRFILSDQIMTLKEVYPDGNGRVATVFIEADVNGIDFSMIDITQLQENIYFELWNGAITDRHRLYGLAFMQGQVDSIIAARLTKFYEQQFDEKVVWINRPDQKGVKRHNFKVLSTVFLVISALLSPLLIFSWPAFLFLFIIVCITILLSAIAISKTTKYNYYVVLESKILFVFQKITYHCQFEDIEEIKVFERKDKEYAKIKVVCKQRKLPSLNYTFIAVKDYVNLQNILNEQIASAKQNKEETRQ